MPHHVFRARLFVVGLLAGVVGLVTGCGGASPTGDVDKVQVELLQLEITVTNISEGSLSDVVAEIVPAGPASHFLHRLGTVSKNETRRIAHSSFVDRDGVSFSRRTTKAKSIIVSGTGVDGKPVRVEVPFKL